jgi:hypothetical protein
MEIRTLMVGMIACAAALDVNAGCAVFPPDYAPDASPGVIAGVVNQRNAWITAGCPATEVVRQQYFQQLYRACVDGLPVPAGIDDRVLVGAVRYANDDYQAKVRGCEKSALVSAEAATFAGTPLVLVAPETKALAE